MGGGRHWLLSATMGLGHDRVIRPLKEGAMDGKVVAIGNEAESSWLERAFLNSTTRFYNFASRQEDRSRLGHFVFETIDRFQRFPDLRPGEDLSTPTVNNRRIDRLLAAGFGAKAFAEIGRRPAPCLSTFYLATQEALRYTELPVYQVVPDAEFNRVYLPSEPRHPRLTNLVACAVAADRMRAYGADPQRLHVTGCPLPLENTGRDGEILRSDHAARTARLSAAGTAPLALMFCIGGAGAQLATVFDLLDQLLPEIREGRYRYVVSCGTNAAVHAAVEKRLARLGLAEPAAGIVHGRTKETYFEAFNAALRATDLLLTKPSELVFYCGLGLPVLLTHPLGHQEFRNQDYLIGTGGGESLDRTRFPAYLREGIRSGRFVERAERGLATGHAQARERILALVHGA